MTPVKHQNIVRAAAEEIAASALTGFVGRPIPTDWHDMRRESLNTLESIANNAVYCAGIRGVRIEVNQGGNATEGVVRISSVWTGELP